MPVSKAFQVEIDPDSKTALLLGPDTDYIVTNLEGFGLPDVRSEDVDRPRDHGVFTSYDYLSGRTLTVSLTVRGDTPENVVANVDALMAHWQPIYSAPDATKTLAFQLPGRPTRRVIGRPRRASVDSTLVKSGRADVVLEFRATDPRIYSDSEFSSSMALPQSGGGATFPLTFDLTFGATSEGGFLFVVNDGNFPTRPVVTITGPVDFPKLLNASTGQHLTLNLSLPAGHTLVIDFDARTVLLDGTASRYSALTPDSEWWEIGPGATLVQFFGATFQANARAALRWRSAWL